jgi:hypothetical protein
MGLLARDLEEAWEDNFILGINDNPPIAIKDRLINVFRFIFLSSC